MKVEIKEPLITERLGNQLWVVVEDFSMSFDSVVYKVPKGFVTDGASAPNITWWLCSPVAGPFGEVAVLHDYLYSLEDPDGDFVDRKLADEILYWGGVYRGASVLRATLVKAAVRIFGGKNFKVQPCIAKLTIKNCYNIHTAHSRVKELRNG